MLRRPTSMLLSNAYVSPVMQNFLVPKRKLSSAEYKDVDEQYRVANIKMITTNLAAQDLKKYGNALDKVTFIENPSSFLITYLMLHISYGILLGSSQVSWCQDSRNQ
jgi:hypothetical protein